MAGRMSDVERWVRVTAVAVAFGAMAAYGLQMEPRFEQLLTESWGAFFVTNASMIAGTIPPWIGFMSIVRRHGPPIVLYAIGAGLHLAGAVGVFLIVEEWLAAPALLSAGVQFWAYRRPSRSSGAVRGGLP